MTARDGWNAAQRAQERELKKPRKMHDPVISPRASLNQLQYDTNHTARRAVVCKACGFHVHAPTCPTQRRPVVLTQPYRNVQITGLTAPEPTRELTLAEAEQACREGKIVRKTRESDGDAPIHEVRFRYVGQFEQLWPNGAYGTYGWVTSMQFPVYKRLTAGECAVMRFEVVS